MSTELTGKLNSVGKNETYGTFTKRLFSIIVEGGKYPQTISFELHQDKVGLIDTYSNGDDLTVTFDIRGKEIPDGRVFNSLVCWKIAGEKSEGKAALREAPVDDFDDDVDF